jgi:hypothetical protein
MINPNQSLLPLLAELSPEKNREYIKFNRHQKQFFGFLKNKKGKDGVFFHCTLEDVCNSEFIPVSNSVRSVNILHSNIEDINQVAIFPENLINVTPQADDPVYYFINRFKHRHETYTKKILNERNIIHLFERIYSFDGKFINTIISNWVNLHEVFHHSGPLPITKNLSIKRTNLNAAVEELRVDLLSITYLAKYKDIFEMAELTILFIFAERYYLYTYIRNRLNYDHISTRMYQNNFNPNFESASTLVSSIIENALILSDLIKGVELEASALGNEELTKQHMRTFATKLLGGEQG